MDLKDNNLVDTYRHSPGDDSPEPLDPPGQHPPQQTNAVGALVGDGLLVGPSVGHDQDAGLAESSLDLISACGERISDGAAAGVPGEKHIC